MARAFEALQAVSDVVSIDSTVRAVRRIGDRNTSVAAQKRAIAMMLSGHHDDGDDGGIEVGSRQSRRARAMVATKKPKIGRCKLHDGGHCKLGDRCRFNHMGEASNGHPPPSSHAAPLPYVAPAPAEVGVEGEAAATRLAQVTAVVARMMRVMSQSLV